MSRTVCLLALLLAGPILGACSGLTPSQQLERMFEKAVSVQPGGRGDSRKELEQRRRDMDRRAERVREMVEADELTGAEDAYRAAVILYDSQETDDIFLAQELALRAHEEGIEDGIRIVAHCMDRTLQMKGRPQRFGTQIVYEPVLGKWRLWDVDPVTTDAEREAFGVEPLAELQARVGYLNERN